MAEGRPDVDFFHHTGAAARHATDDLIRLDTFTPTEATGGGGNVKYIYRRSGNHIWYPERRRLWKTEEDQYPGLR